MARALPRWKERESREIRELPRSRGDGGLRHEHSSRVDTVQALEVANAQEK